VIVWSMSLAGGERICLHCQRLDSQSGRV